MTRQFQYYINEAEKINSSLINSQTPNSLVSKSKTDYLIGKYKALKLLKNHHSELGRTYYANYYTITLDLIILISILSLIFITTTNIGLKNTSIYLRVIFYTVLAIAVFLTTITLTFSHKENYTNNFKQFIYYDNLQNNIIAFIKTSDGIDSSRSTIIVDSFINKLNIDFTHSNSIISDIDASKISFDNMNKFIEVK